MIKQALTLVFTFCTFATALSAAEDEPTVSENNNLKFEDEQLIAAVDNISPGGGGFVDRDAGPKDQGDEESKRVLRDFIESKGLIECRQKEGLLTIAGDVRARWLATGEEVNGVKKRGTGTDYAVNFFRSEVNLYLDYAAKRSWVATKLKFVNIDGVDGGSATRTELERAFIGYDIFERGKEDFYIEVGRTKMDYLYESSLEFSSIFDGIHLFYTNVWPCLGPFTIHGGPFIVDSFSNHYGWVVETYFSNLWDSGFSIKYSIIDWLRGAKTYDYGNLKANPVTGKPSGEVDLRNNPRYQFVVAQLLLGYEREVSLPRCKTLFVYGAFLDNFAAKKVKQTDYTKANLAWYAGFTLGELCKACDWSLDINYQYLQAQAVPEFDLNGIGHGNTDDGLLSDWIILGSNPGALSIFTNYQGLEASFLFALTNTLTLKTRAAYSVPINKAISGPFHYKGFEMAVIYAF